MEGGRLLLMNNFEKNIFGGEGRQQVMMRENLLLHICSFLNQFFEKIYRLTGYQFLE